MRELIRTRKGTLVSAGRLHKFFKLRSFRLAVLLRTCKSVSIKMLKNKAKKKKPKQTKVLIPGPLTSIIIQYKVQFTNHQIPYE